jgi:hypothetical protein
MSKGTKVLALMLVILAGVYVMAADATKDYGVGQTRTIELTDKATVGNVQLRAGEYKVTHVMDGGNHVLVFKNDKKKEVARVSCTMVDLPKKADRNTQEYVTKGNDRVLSGLTFNGESFKHQF